MSKKFSIAMTVNIKKLEDEIVSYGGTNPYIFMHIDTLRAIANEYNISLNLAKDCKLDGYSAEYIGYKIYVNNDLKFGEVEIR